ncbi:MAG TPA: ABC transporter permease subunit [Dongiaceae bacterium]|jgi:multiple sugar transport system permease protein/putative spermidine/putrescine transport system permease protein|nr:ABC transporter permease subunit [Dongiaceae bacterium]
MNALWFIRSPRLRWLIGGLIVAATVTVFVFPMIIAVLWSLVDPNVGWFPPHVLPPGYSLDNWRALFAVPELSQAFLTSFIVAVLVTLLSLLLGFPTSYAIARRNLRHRRLIELLVLLPLTLPSVVLVTGLGSVFIRLGLSQTMAGVVLAQCIVVMPFTIRILTATLSGVPQDLIDAASNLGGGPLTVVRRVLLPMVMPGLFAASLLAFVNSLEEFLLSFVVGMPTVQTLPMLLWAYLGGRSSIQTYAAVVSLVLLIPTLAMLFVAERVLKQEHLAAGFGKG